MQFEGKVVVVAGGAGGIGSAICERFAREGAHVVCADQSERRGRALEGELHALGHSVTYASLDAGDEQSWRALARSVGRCDTLVTAVYSGPAAGFDELSASDWDAGFHVTARGVFLGMNAFAPLFQRGGSIINIASVMAHGRAPENAAYSAAKAAVIALSKSAAARFGARGVRVNVVTPGLIETRALRGNFEALARDGRSAEDVERAYLRRVPLGRVGAPADIAGAVAFLAGAEAAYVTGAEIIVDGGFSVL